MEILYEVILATQKARTDLQKWKLIIVATMGGAGLGLTNVNNFPHIELVLCCIPFACAYVDSLCGHYSLRVQVIAKFLRIAHFKDKIQLPEFFHFYEIFVHKTRECKKSNNIFPKLLKKGTINILSMESWAIYLSSYLISALIIVYGYLVKNQAVWITGIIGIALTTFIWWNYQKRNASLNALEEERIIELVESKSHGSVIEK